MKIPALSAGAGELACVLTSVPLTKKRRVPAASRETATWNQAPSVAVTPEHFVELPAR